MSILSAVADKVIQQGRKAAGQMNVADVQQAYSAYDEFLWAVLTAPREELAAFAKLLFDRPYMDLPPPLQVVVFRLVGLEFPNDIEKLQLANTGISMYCSPAEEQHAAGSIRARLNELTRKA
ncbi:MAG: hypothetical protein QXP01_09260 [Candidatus Hadarchaeum sp.]